jgi:hypothetical protein
MAKGRRAKKIAALSLSKGEGEKVSVVRQAHHGSTSSPWFDKLTMVRQDHHGSEYCCPEPVEGQTLKTVLHPHGSTSSRWFDKLTTADRLTMVRQAHHGKTPCFPEALSLSKGEGQT